MDDRPLISLVIPTRERAETLFHTLRTAVEQDEDDCEILVCDNAGRDQTCSVVKSFNDSRLRYVNPGRRLPMSENWNFAVEHVRGRYVVIIGDDDGVMPGGLKRLRLLIEARPANVYYWQISEYFWPIDDFPPVISHVSPISQPRDVDLVPLAKFAVRWGTWRYGSLPLGYHSAVARELFDTMRARTGKVFHSTNPDVFMAFALPALCGHAINTGESYTVSGRSGKANGGARIAADGQTVFQKFVNEYEDYRLHPTLHPGIPLAINMYGDSALKAMDLFPDFYRDTPFNYSAMYAHAHRIVGALSVRGTLAMRSEIQKRQPFSAVRFLAYCILHEVMELRVLLRRKMIRGRYTPSAADMPRDIYATVHYLARAQRRLS